MGRSVRGLFCEEITMVRQAQLPHKARQSKTRRPEINRLRSRPLLELLEDRTAPALSVPTLIDPTAAQQVLFGPDVTRHTLPNAAAETYLRFALDSVQDGPVHIRVAPAGGTSADGAAAVFDADGNLLQKVDDDGDPNGAEEMTITLDSRREYILGVFRDPGPGVPPNFDVTVTAGPLTLNAPIQIDPATGSVLRTAGDPEDLFNGQADVDYYPLILHNAGPSASVTVTPSSLDVDPFVNILRLNPGLGRWQSVAQGRASIVGTFAVSSLPGQNLTDEQLLIAVAPAGFNTAGGAYQIAISTPLLGPATVALPPETALAPRSRAFYGSTPRIRWPWRSSTASAPPWMGRRR